MNHDVRQVVLDALREMNYDVVDATDETQLGPAGLDLESLAIAELAIRLEDAYQVRLDDDETEQFAVMTLGEFVSAVSERIELTKPAGTSG